MASTKKRKAQVPADGEPGSPLTAYTSSSFNCLADGFNMAGKVALVTGGRGWLGTAICEALAEAGCSVIVASRELDKAQDAAKRLPRLPAASAPAQRHAGVQLDHLDEDAARRGFQAAVDAGRGRVDVVINNGLSGINARSNAAQEARKQDIAGTEYEDFADLQRNNAGYFLLARLLRDHVVGRRAGAATAATGGSATKAADAEAKGAVVMIGSMYGQVASYPDAYEGLPYASPVAYHCTKGGTVHLTRHLAAYWAKDGVRVNCLSPGPFPGPGAPRELVKRLCTKLPMGRMGLPHELKGPLLLLASDAGSYITGQNLTVDGGWTCW